MGTSVPCESVFSDSGQVNTPHRSSFIDENFWQLMLLRACRRLDAVGEEGDSMSITSKINQDEVEEELDQPVGESESEDELHESV